MYYTKLQFPNIYYNCMYYTQPPGVAQQYPNMFDNNLQSSSMYYTCMYYTQPPGVVQQAPSMYYNNLQFPSIYCTQPPVSQQVLQRTLTSGHPFPARTTSLPSYAAEEKKRYKKTTSTTDKNKTQETGRFSHTALTWSSRPMAFVSRCSSRTWCLIKGRPVWNNENKQNYTARPLPAWCPLPVLPQIRFSGDG